LAEAKTRIKQQGRQGKEGEQKLAGPDSGSKNNRGVASRAGQGSKGRQGRRRGAKIGRKRRHARRRNIAAVAMGRWEQAIRGSEDMHWSSKREWVEPCSDDIWCIK
jgi:hypothetical protein